ncbi:DUF6615 family protein [Pseudescherichia sp.]|uniref:DUF6615 family protein n=1 Tax=Pseudescherichia sp. TaxID=2055881 RepID=UPI00289F3419|nr:DUF6615 family protein [Pseudescherichia sp.]
MNVFYDISEYVWDLLIDGKKLGISIGEETISDLILIEIARKNYNYVTIRKTAKDKEAESGTDWEWWIGSIKNGWVRYAIQAKKMDYNQYSYKTLKHEVGKDKKLQYEILRKHAKNMKAIALYAFYNYPKQTQLDEYWNCQKPISKKKMGITIANLEFVARAINIKRGKNFPTIHKFKTTYPLCCLLECISTYEKKIYKPHAFPQSPSVMTLSYSNISTLDLDYETIEQHKLNEKDVSLNHILQGYDVSKLFNDDEVFDKAKGYLYPNNTPVPKRILVIDLELLKNTKKES